MKCSVLLATIACVLSGTLANNEHKVVQAHSEVMSHVSQKMGGMPMMRSNSAHMECYNSFLPSIEELASKARSDSQTCVDQAASAEEFRVSGLKDKRIAVEDDIAKIKRSLAECQSRSGLEFFKCLSDATEENKDILKVIGERSVNVLNNQSESVDEIEAREKACLRTAVDTAKNASDKEFKKLSICLKLEAEEVQPLEDPQQPSEEVNQEPSAEDHQQPSDEDAQQPSGEVAQHPSDEDAQQPSGELDHQPSEELDHQPSEELDHQPSPEDHQQPSDEDAQQPSGEVAQHPSDEVAQQPSLTGLDQQPSILLAAPQVSYV